MKTDTAGCILVAFDFGALSRAAWRWSRALGRKLGAPAAAVYVCPWHPAVDGPPALPLLSPRERRALELRLRLAAPGARSARVVEGDVAREIVREAERLGAALVVVGTHGRRGVKRLFLGSVAEAVLRASPVPVVSLRAPAPPPGRTPRRQP